MKQKRGVIFWEVGNYRETLIHETIDDALEEYTNDLTETIIGPHMVEMCGYARMEFNAASTYPLYHVLDALDEEFGDPDGDVSGLTRAMLDAERSFIDVINREYEPWACEIVERRVVDVLDWLRHRGDSEQ